MSCAEKSFKTPTCIHSDCPNIKITLRWVILKGMTDSVSELKLLSEFALELVPYHELGKDKDASLDMAYPLEDAPAYKHEDAVAVQKKLEDAGVTVILSSV